MTDIYRFHVIHGKNLNGIIHVINGQEINICFLLIARLKSLIEIHNYKCYIYILLCSIVNASNTCNKRVMLVIRSSKTEFNVKMLVYCKKKIYISMKCNTTIN